MKLSTTMYISLLVYHVILPEHRIKKVLDFNSSVSFTNGQSYPLVVENHDAPDCVVQLPRG